MSDNRKYYYMKVKESFFDSEEMKILESQKNGEKYQNLYLKLCLLSLKEQGSLMFKGKIPYDMEMLSTILRVDIDTIKTGTEIFQKLGLIDILDSGEMFMTDIQTLIGKSSTEAERIKEYRKSISDKKCTNVLQMLPTCTPEIEIDSEKDINKKEKEKPIKNKYSEDFERFWNEYPKKAGKEYSLKSFNKLIKEGLTIDIILQRLSVYKEKIKKLKTDYEYIRNPKTFLDNIDDYSSDNSQQKTTNEFRPATNKEKNCPLCGGVLKGSACTKCYANFDSEGNEI